MMKVNQLGLLGLNRPEDISDSSAPAYKTYKSRNYYILDRNLRVVFIYHYELK